MAPRPSPKLRVSLNGRSSLRFVPRVPSGGVLLGVVQRGMHIGALARLPDGSFVQVNGDVIQPLNRSQVETALRKASVPTERSMAAPAAMPVSTDAVPVTIKRRRRLATHEG